MVTRVHSYLNIMYKYAGKEIDIMIEHFTNTAVYAVVIEDIIDTTVDKINFHWDQNVILFVNREATAMMNTEIWKRFLISRDEIFKTDEKIFISAITVRELIHEDNTSLTFYSELEKSITKETVVQNQTDTKQEKHTTQKKQEKHTTQKKLQKRTSHEAIDKSITNMKNQHRDARDSRYHW